MAIHNRLFESRELRLFAVLGISSLFVLLCGVAAAAESKAGDRALEIVLAAWEKSAARLQSYDLH